MKISKMFREVNCWENISSKAKANKNESFLKYTYSKIYCNNGIVSPLNRFSIFAIMWKSKSVYLIFCYVFKKEAELGIQKKMLK